MQPLAPLEPWAALSTHSTPRKGVFEKVNLRRLAGKQVDADHIEARRRVGLIGAQKKRRHAAQFTSVDRVLAELRPGPLGLGERIYESIAMWRVKASRSRKRVRRRVRD